MYNFQRLEKLADLRGKTVSNGKYTDYGVDSKTDITVHHSLTKSGDSSAFANYHVNQLGWHGVAYHFVILKDGTIEWNHNLGLRSYHVGDWNTQAVGVCLVGDFRTEEPTKAQKESLKQLHDALVKDLPNYKVTKGHNEYPDYTWKACPEFDYKKVISGDVDSKSSYKYDPNKGIGTLRVKVPALNVRDEASFNSNVLKTIKENDIYYVYKEENGLYNIGGDAWVSANSKYVGFTPHPKQEKEPEPEPKEEEKTYYRLETGVFGSKEVAEQEAQKLRNENGWTVRVKKA